MTKWQIFRSEDNTWSEALDADQIVELVMQGKIDQSDEARWIDSDFSAPVGRFRDIGDRLASLAVARHEAALRAFGGSLRLLQFEHELARQAKAVDSSDLQEKAELEENQEPGHPPDGHTPEQAEELDQAIKNLIATEFLGRESNFQEFPTDQKEAKAEPHIEEIGSNPATIDPMPSIGSTEEVEVAIDDQPQEPGDRQAAPDDESSSTSTASVPTVVEQSPATIASSIPSAEVSEGGLPLLVDSGRETAGTATKNEMVPASPQMPATATDGQQGEIVFYGVIKRNGQIRLDTRPIVSFKKENIRGGPKIPDYPAGSRVEVTLKSGSSRLVADTVKLKELVSSFPRPLWHSSEALVTRYKSELAAQMRSGRNPASILASWSDIQVEPLLIKGRKEYFSDDLHNLAKKARTETWRFKDESDEYSILRAYLKFTFYRLACENKIGFSEEFAAFNTGLVDKLREPIFALFQRNELTANWWFQDFCTPGVGHSGKILIDLFGGPQLPTMAKYFEKLSDILFNHDYQIFPKWPHVIDDALARQRYPLDFMMQHLPRGLAKTPPNRKTKEWCLEYARLLERDEDTYEAFKDNLEQAIKKAQDRVRSNFQAAIPNYFARHNTMSFLLPLNLLKGKTPELALVVEDRDQSYYAATVYPLDWAYQYARLVRRPDTDWLSRKDITPSGLEIDGDEE